MSIGGVAFWNSDYAYQIMNTKKTSYLPQDFVPKTSEKSVTEEEFTGFKPRVDEYIPDIKFLGQKPEDTENKKESAEAKTSEKSENYSEEEQKAIDELKSRDTEVRAHEQAHVSAGGAHITGGISYTMQTGPDGKQYAIGGEVSIDTSPVSGNPEATIAKMQSVKAAAMAPASPSDADRAVAASAVQIEANARAELLEKNNRQNDEVGNNTENSQVKETDENVKNNERAQNNIVAAISAYTNNFGAEFSSKINFAV